MRTLDPAVARVLKRLHYPLEVILTGSVAITEAGMLGDLTE